MKRTYAAAIGTILAVASIDASADRFFVVNADCRKFDQARDAVQCAVSQHNGADRLFIRILAKPSDSQQRKDHVRYLVESTIHNYFARGGNEIAMRSTNKAGEIIERNCHRRAGIAREICGDWYVIASDPVLGKSSLRR